MTQFEESRLQIAMEIYAELAPNQMLARNQARLFARCFQSTWNVPTIAWREGESKIQLADARRLLHAASIFQDVQGQGSHYATSCYRRAAELLEWLARARDKNSTTTPIELLAAGAYQLAGYPAMATAMLNLYSSIDLGARLYSRFLQADFDGVLEIAAEYWRDNAALSGRQGSSDLANDRSRADGLEIFFVSELVRVLGLIADTLRRGDENRLALAMRKFLALDKMATRTVDDDVAMLVSILRQSATRFFEASIYGPLMRLAADNSAMEEKVRHFARVQFTRKRGILWASQQQGIRRLLENSSFALCTPTGSGKTLVANMALIKELLINRQSQEVTPLALYLVPSRALAGEVEAKLQSELGDDLIITGLYGGADWGITDYWLQAQKPTVLIATVEKADALMRYLGRFLIRRLQILIVDEAHQVVADASMGGKEYAEHSSRSFRLEGFVTRLLAQKPDLHRIALTAVAGGASRPVAAWMEGRADAEPVGTNFRSTRQVVGKMEAMPYVGSQISLDLVDGQRLSVIDRDSAVFVGLRIPPMPRPAATIRNSLDHVNQLSILWSALHLLNGGRRILISVLQSPQKTMKWYVEALDMPAWSEIGSFNPPTTRNLANLWSAALSACNDYCGMDSYEFKLLQRGIATNHGQMPQRLRRLMTGLIESGVCSITIATATLTEGVNLPFDLIFLSSLQRVRFHDATNGREVVPISISEFRNLAGRAGRPGHGSSMEGITLVSIPIQPTTTAQSKVPEQRRQIQGLKDNYNNLLTRLEGENQVQAVTSPLTNLLLTIKQQFAELFGIFDEERFLAWLESAIPFELAENAATGHSAPQSRLADTVDDLDGFLLAALEELRSADARDLTGSAAETWLIQLWRKTFSSIAAHQQDWLERAVALRGRGIVETVYPDQAVRRRIYQYGFTPCVSLRFELVMPALLAQLRSAENYGVLPKAERVELFERLGTLLNSLDGFGFKFRNTNVDNRIRSRWSIVLRWWMQADETIRPDSSELRDWQRFVADNLDFRLGVAIGAAVAQIWTSSVDDPNAIPALATWRDVTGLPWFGFWARELLRWGTLDPFVAFAMAQGLASTRLGAEQRRPAFDSWLKMQIESPLPDDFIDPQHFLRWQRSMRPEVIESSNEGPYEAQLFAASGENAPYHVLPMKMNGWVAWLDAAGYQIGGSFSEETIRRQISINRDYELYMDNGQANVREVYSVVR